MSTPKDEGAGNELEEVVEGLFSHCGKELLYGKKHVADCSDNAVAEWMSDALNYWKDVVPFP